MDVHGAYQGHEKTPAEHLREAEKILLSFDAADFDQMLLGTQVNYARALIELASAQMMGSLRR